MKKYTLYCLIVIAMFVLGMHAIVSSEEPNLQEDLESSKIINGTELVDSDSVIIVSSAKVGVMLHDTPL